MTHQPTLLSQFRSFCFQNPTADIEQAIEYFAVFGGMGWKVDMTKPLHELIIEKVFTNYRYIHADITAITESSQIHHRVLSALATGDGREHSAFKNAKVSRAEGEKSIDFLVEHGLLIRESTIEPPKDTSEIVSDKYRFAAPFMRFWFAAVSPYYKGIKAGDFTEALSQWHNMRHEFPFLMMVALFREVVKKSFVEDPIKNIGAYWDKHVEIDLLGVTASGRTIAGALKLSKSKMSKSELAELKTKCDKAALGIDIYALYSKNKFSNELKNERGDALLLFSPKHLTALLSDLSKRDLLVHTNKKY